MFVYIGPTQGPTYTANFLIDLPPEFWPKISLKIETGFSPLNCLPGVKLPRGGVDGEECPGARDEPVFPLRLRAAGALGFREDLPEAARLAVQLGHGLVDAGP